MSAGGLARDRFDESPAERTPKTAKAERTRGQILIAARTVFERDGYVDARIADIARAAGVAHGTFYTYFTTKDEAFVEVAKTVVDDLYENTTSVYRGDDPIARVRSANEQFIHTFRTNAKFIRVIEQVATMNHEFESMRRSLRSRAAERVEVTITRYIEQGIADPAIEPHIASHALIGMVYYFCYAWLSLGEPFDDEAAAETLTVLWAKALGIRSPAESAPRARRR
jgi:AcrR family transcriptional regulator